MKTLTLKEPVYTELVPETTKGVTLHFEDEDEFGELQSIDFEDEDDGNDLHHSILDFIQDLSRNISDEIYTYTSNGLYPYDDVTDDILQAIDLLQEVACFHRSNF